MNYVFDPCDFRMVRAPVPWHDTYRQGKEFNQGHLFVTNPMMLELQNIWFDQYVLSKLHT